MPGTQAKTGFVGLLVSCEMEQPSLQKLLYDLEAGMPFLFIDQLDVQVPQLTAVNDRGVGRSGSCLGSPGNGRVGSRSAHGPENTPTDTALRHVGIERLDAGAVCNAILDVGHPA
jgi:hypothetical protein